MKKSTILILVFIQVMILSAMASYASGQTVNLAKDWNLVSFQKLPSDDVLIETILADVLPKVRIVWGYENTSKQWKKWKPQGGAGNTLTTVEFGKGYWIYMDDTGSIVTSQWSAAPSALSVPLVAGWNLVGYIGTDNSPVTDRLQSLAGKWNILWNWTNGQWYAKHAAVTTLPVQPLTALNQGKAYWIKATQAVGWDQSGGDTTSVPPVTADEMGKSIKEQLASTRAYEIFGQSVMTDFLAEVNRMLALAYGKAGKAPLSVSTKRVKPAGNCETIDGTFEKDGFTYGGSMTMCPNEEDDKFVLKYQFVSGMSDLAGTQKGLRFEIGIDAETNKCPTSEGKLTGSALTHYLLYVSDGTTTTNVAADAQLDMNATIDDNAEVEKVELTSNLGLAVNETGFPPVGYNGVSRANGTEFDLTGSSYGDQIMNSMSPVAQADNPKTVGQAMGMGVGMVLGAMQGVAKDAENNWKTDGKCVQIKITPEAPKMGTGEKKQVEAKVILIKDESHVEAKLQASSECGESITPATAQYVPDTKEKFDYTTPKNGKAGCFTIKATSKAGKDSHDVTINYAMSIHLDSTITSTIAEGTLTGHIKSIIPLADKDGIMSGSAPITYVSFQQTIPASGCSFVTGPLSASDAQINSFSLNYEAPGATQMVLLPFHAYESYTVSCPDSDPFPSGSIEFFFSGYFFTLHFDEFSENTGWTMTNWTQGTEPGIPLLKRYERTQNVEGANITETTVIELHAGPEE